MTVKQAVGTAMLGAFLGLVTVTGAYADYVDDRQANQEERIEQGVESGQLTSKEYNKLEAKEKRIDNMQEKFGKDGVLAPKEKFKLEKALDRTSWDIYKQKHDRQTQDGVKPNFPGPYPKPMGIDAREHRQVNRIEQGVKNGSLTPGELKRLGAEQGKIRWEEAKFKSDGKFTARERTKVQHDLNQSSRHIYRAKHNGRAR